MNLTFGDFLIGYTCLVLLIAALLVAGNYRIEQRHKRESKEDGQ